MLKLRRDDVNIIRPAHMHKKTFNRCLAIFDDVAAAYPLSISSDSLCMRRDLKPLQLRKCLNFLHGRGFILLDRKFWIAACPRRLVVNGTQLLNDEDVLFDESIKDISPANLDKIHRRAWTDMDHGRYYRK